MVGYGNPTYGWGATAPSRHAEPNQPGVGDEGSLDTCPCQDETHLLHAVGIGPVEVQDLQVDIRVHGKCGTPSAPPDLLPLAPLDSTGPDISNTREPAQNRGLVLIPGCPTSVREHFMLLGGVVSLKHLHILIQRPAAHKRHKTQFT